MVWNFVKLIHLEAEFSCAKLPHWIDYVFRGWITLQQTQLDVFVLEIVKSTSLVTRLPWSNLWHSNVLVLWYFIKTNVNFWWFTVFLEWIVGFILDENWPLTLFLVQVPSMGSLRVVVRAGDRAWYRTFNDWLWRVLVTKSTFRFWLIMVVMLTSFLRQSKHVCISLAGTCMRLLCFLISESLSGFLSL